MPVLINSLLKDKAIEFLKENEIEFSAEATKPDLIQMIRDSLVSSGYDPDWFDFETRKQLQLPPVNGAQADPHGTPGSPHVRHRDLPPPAAFELEPAHNAASRWDKWLARFDVYSSAIVLCNESMEVQRSVLLHVAGAEVLDLLESLEEDSGEADLVKRARKALTGYFRPRKNRHFERHLFMAIKQEPDEAVDSFMARLRSQAVSCAFPNLDERLLEQLIECCSSPSLRKKLLERGDDLDLKKALDVARSFESVNAQSSAMSKPQLTPSSVSAVDGGQKPQKCKFCGTMHFFKKELCPAFGKNCADCGRPNHTASTCWRKNQKSSSSTPPKNERGERKKVRGKGGTKKKVRHVDQTCSGEESSDEENTMIVSAVGPLKNRSALYTALDVAGKLVNFLLDTGASLNLIPLSAVPKDVVVSPSDHEVRTYDGTLLPTKGKVVLRVVHPRQKK